MLRRWVRAGYRPPWAGDEQAREQRLLANIERLTRQQVPIAPVPSVADLRARQVDQIRSAVRDRAAAGGFEDVRAVVDVLADELDAVEIALAAVALLHEASGAAGDEADIPEVAPRKGGKGGKGAKAGKGGKAGKGPKGKGGGDAVASGPTTKLWISMGKAEGVRPKDLVGAIANETHLTGREIGPISITDGFSTVGVPSEAADDVIAAMAKASIRGKRAKVRRDRQP